MERTAQRAPEDLPRAALEWLARRPWRAFLCRHGNRRCFAVAPQRAALLSPLLMFPLVYYVVAYMPRYREPSDWAFLLLAGTTLWHLLGGRRHGRG